MPRIILNLIVTLLVLILSRPTIACVQILKEGGARDLLGVNDISPNYIFKFNRIISETKSGDFQVEEECDFEIPATKEKKVLVLRSVGRSAESHSYLVLQNVLQLDKSGVAQSVSLIDKKMEIHDFFEQSVKIEYSYFEIPAEETNRRYRYRFIHRIDNVDALQSEFMNLNFSSAEEIIQANLIYRINTRLPLKVVAGSNFRVDHQSQKDGSEEVIFTLKQPWIRKDAETGVLNLALSNSTWPEIAARHAPAYRRDLNMSTLDESLRKLAFEYNPQLRFVEDKLEIAHQLFLYVQTNYAYKQGLFSFASNGKFTPDSLVQTIKHKSGSCKELAMLYIKLLSLFNIRSEPVELNNYERHQKIQKQKIPQLHAFNHVIVYLNELDIYVDPTIKVSQFKQDYSGFAIANWEYADHDGLFLFSERYKEKLIDSVMPSELHVLTTWSFDGNQWIANSEFSAKGMNYLTLSNLNFYRQKFKDSIENPPSFKKLNFELISDTWEMWRDDKKAEARLRFSYRALENPIFKDGHRIFFPTVPYVNFLIWYARQGNDSAIPAIEQQTITENILIKSAVAKKLDFKELNFGGRGNTFFQKISSDVSGYRLVRKLHLVERISEAEVNQSLDLSKFYKDISSSTLNVNASEISK